MRKLPHANPPSQAVGANLFAHPPYRRPAPKPLIACKFGPPSEPIRTRITQADSDTLLMWFDRAIDARSIDEVLR